ncbi:hypothetical protein X777_02121, partial [Ooceraea biroi]
RIRGKITSKLKLQSPQIRRGVAKSKREVNIVHILVHTHIGINEREREGETKKERTLLDFHGNSVSRAFSCCKSSPKPGSNNGSGLPRDIQPLGALACISIRYPFPRGREESPQSSRRVEAGRRLLCTSVHALGAIVRGPENSRSIESLTRETRRLIFDEASQVARVGNSRDEAATLIRILLTRDEETGRVTRGNAAARFRKFGYAA